MHETLGVLDNPRNRIAGSNISQFYILLDDAKIAFNACPSACTFNHCDLSGGCNIGNVNHCTAPKRHQMNQVRESTLNVMPG